MVRIAVMNQKGGVGKTTSAVNLAASYGKKGYEVLLVDLDPQSSATMSLGYEEDQIEHSIYDLLTGSSSFSRVCIRAENFDLLPSELDLSGFEAEVNGLKRLRTVLHRSEDQYDLVFVDCPPSIGMLSLNALSYAEYILIPIRCGFLSLQGITTLLKSIRKVKRTIHSGLQILGIVVCMYDARTSLSEEVYEEVHRHFGDLALDTAIRVNVRLAEAPSFGNSIIEYAPDSRGAKDYMKLSEELLERLKKAGAFTTTKKNVVPQS